MSREKTLKKFIFALDEVIDGNYLFATKKMEELVVIVLNSKILFELFEYCGDGFDYDEYCRRHPSGSENLVPKTPKEQLAYVFRLISDFAAGRMDLSEYLKANFFVKNSYFESYTEFCRRVLSPFKFLVKATVEQMIDEKSAKPQRTYTDLDFKYLEEIVRLLEQDKMSILQSGIKDQLKDELIIIIDNFIEHTAKFDIAGVGSFYIAYKHAVTAVKKLNTNYEQITEMLTDHGVINKNN